MAIARAAKSLNHMNTSATTLDRVRPLLPVRLVNGFGALLPKTRTPAGRTVAMALIMKAKRRCGFDDFGEGDFLEGLWRLLESCQREARLNLIGRIALRVDVLQTLCSRLRMQQDRKVYPGIVRQEIREPLFVVGLPRSGTTLLHSLLAADPEHRCPLMWEVMMPSPPTSDGEKRRIQRAAKSCNYFNWLAPSFRHVHPVGANVPQECVGLMAATFMSDQFDTMFYVPSYRGWFFQQDLRPAYEYHRRFLQHLQFRQNARRWILKAPTHMFAMPALLSAYPDALFVQTHRTPVDAMASVSSLVTILRNAFSNAVDPFIACREAIDYWSDTMDKFLQQRDRLPSSRICDVEYGELCRDPIAAVERIYHHFGWLLAPEARQRMQGLLATNVRWQAGNHRYDLSQFGFSADEVLSAFSSYCERFGAYLGEEKSFGGARTGRLVA
jgi:Sulfotransferase family